MKPTLRLIAGRPIHSERNLQQPPEPPAPPAGRLVRGGWWPRAANAPMVVRPEEEKPLDAADFMNGVLLVAAGLAGLALVVILCIALFSLVRVA